jgi:putative transposase
MRFRLQPTAAKEQSLLGHNRHARFIWNLAVERHQHRRPGRASAPGHAEQFRRLTEAGKEFSWPAAGFQTVRQQALRDFAQAMSNFFAGTHGRPTWRKAGRHEGLRIVGRPGRQWDTRRVSRKAGQVWIPKIGWVRFHWSRAVPDSVRSYRITRDSADRRHVAFAAVPEPLDGPGDGGTVGIDRGGAASAALSTGDLLRVPAAPGRVEKIKPACTSQTCDACGHCDPKYRESQAVFRCRVRKHLDHADVNAANNIAAGRAVTARGGRPMGRPVNREPQLVISSA